MNELLKRINTSKWWRLLLLLVVPYLFNCLLNPLFFDASGWALVSVQLYGWLFAFLFMYLCAAIPYVGRVMLCAVFIVF